jgi:hypothetical protein
MKWYTWLYNPILAYRLFRLKKDVAALHGCIDGYAGAADQAISVDVDEHSLIVLSADKPISGEQAEALRAHWQHFYQKAGQQVIILGDGLQLKVLQRKPNDEPQVQDAEEAEAANIQSLTYKFLSWQLPDSVCADQCATVTNYPHRTGTNLLTYAEAEAMIRHLLSDAP